MWTPPNVHRFLRNSVCSRDRRNASISYRFPISSLSTIVSTTRRPSVLPFVSTDFSSRDFLLSERATRASFRPDESRVTRRVGQRDANKIIQRIDPFCLSSVSPIALLDFYLEARNLIPDVSLKDIERMIVRIVGLQGPCTARLATYFAYFYPSPITRLADPDIGRLV